MVDLAFLKTIDLFEGLSDEDLLLLSPLARKVVFQEGEVIFHEGEPGKDLYIIRRGEVKIFKREDPEVLYPLARLKTGEWFGEMAFFGSNARSASAKALEPTEAVAISLTELNALSKKEPAYSKIGFNIAKKMGSRLKDLNEGFVRSLKKEMHFVRVHDLMSRLIIYIFFLFVGFFYSYKFVEQYLHAGWAVSIAPGLLILGFSVSVAFLVKQSGFPLEFYGLTLKHWKKNAAVGFLLTVPILIGMIVLKWMLIQIVPAFQGLPLFSLGSSGGFLHSQHSFLPVLLYTALVPLQEFITRGCLQGCLEHFFQSSNRVFLSILASNLLFLLFHGLKSFSFAGLAFLFGMYWGWIYSGQRSIVGSSVSHALVGLLAFGFLDYQRIWIY